MCQTCGMEEVYQPFEHAQGEGPSTCGVPLKRKKGQFCKSMPRKDGLCWRHSKQPCQQDDADENIHIGGKIKIKETIKELRRIAKDEGLTGVSRMLKEKMVKLIEEKTNRSLPAKRTSQRRS